MNYNKILELENLTLEDCLDLNSKGYKIILNDGMVVNLEKE